MKVFFELVNHNIYSVSGADVERYLQGRLTQNIKKVKAQQAYGAMLLTPQGKILAKMHVIKEQGRFLLLVDPCNNEDFLKDLLRFKVADDVSVSKLDSSLFTALEDFQSTLIKIPSKRFKESGFDIIVTENEKANLLKELDSQGFKLGTEQERDFLRISSNQPEYGKDINQSITATEVPFQDYISFDKGCYAGQEVVEMSTARGRPNRQLLSLSCERPLEKGDEIFSSKDLSKACGFIQTVATNEKQTIAFAYIKTSYAEQSEFFHKDQTLSKINA